MAKKQKGPSLSGNEIANLGSRVEDLAKGMGKTRGQMEKMLGSGIKMSKKMEKELEKVHSSLMSNSKALSEQIAKNQVLAQMGGSVGKQARNDLKIDFQKKKSLEGQINSIEKLQSGTEGWLGGLGEIGAAIPEIEAAFAALGAVTGPIAIIGLAVAGIVKLFTTWYEMEKKIVVATGKLNRTLGATADQSKVAAENAEQLRDTFSRLEGDVDGINDSFQFVGELAVAMQDGAKQTHQYQKNVLALNRGLGLTVDQVVQLDETAKSAFGMEKLEDLGGRMLDFAHDAGIPGSVIAKGMVENESNMAEFGKQGPRVFEKVSLFAKKLKTNVSKIFEGMKKFDYFDTATESINQLNVMMGTSISSFDMMMTQDPAERLEKVRSALKASGADWEHMTRYQRRATAETIGLTEAETARLFKEGIGLKDLEAQQESAAKKREAGEAAGIDNQLKIQKLLERSSIVFEDMGRIFDRIWQHVARKLGPIFKKVFGVAQDGAQGFGDIVDKLINNPKFEAFIDGFAEAIGKAVDWFVKLDWDKVSAKLGEFFDNAMLIADVGGKMMADFVAATAKLEPMISLAERLGLTFDSVSKSVETVFNHFTGFDKIVAGAKILDRLSSGPEVPPVKEAIGNFDRTNKRGLDISSAVSSPTEVATSKTSAASVNLASENKSLEIKNNITMKGDVVLDGKVVGKVIFGGATSLSRAT